jgi:uncharacterized protein with HEPN domain
MLNNGLIIEILKQILSSINTIERRMKTIVFDVCINEIPKLKKMIKLILVQVTVK